MESALHARNICFLLLIDVSVRLLFSYAMNVGGAWQESLLQRTNPRKFEYARPLKAWRKEWPEVYHRFLSQVQEKWPEGRGVKEFVRVLRLHQEAPAALIEQAVTQALAYGCPHFDGVSHCLQHLLHPSISLSALDLSAHPQLNQIGTQPIDLSCYDQLIERQHTCYDQRIVTGNLLEATQAPLFP